MAVNYSDIQFTKEENFFIPNLNADYALFAIWKKAQPYKEEIKQVLSSSFEIVLETEIVWSEKHFHANASRLYEVPVFQNIDNEDLQSSHEKKIGGFQFIVIVVKDKVPKYSHAMSVSKKIELSNLNVVDAKRKVRDIVFKAEGVKYGVHSTNSIYEFFFQAPLLFGMDIFKQLINEEKPKLEKLSKDLEGANGWSNWESVFEILNATNNYVVLRGYEGLPAENPDKDVDLLTDNYQRIASALGAKQLSSKHYKGRIVVNNEETPIDIRFVGDHYYDTSMSKDMLDTKVNKNGFYELQDDFYFFSLLFHCKVQKAEVKEKYIGILDQLAKKLNYNWYLKETVFDDKAVGEILNGYFQSHHYYYRDPLDHGVFKNTKIIRHLPRIDDSPKKRSLKSIVKKVMPSWLFRFLRKLIKG